MCGRYSIAAEPEVLEEHFGATFEDSSVSIEKRYNAAPSQALPVILNAEPERIRLVSWGINPWWLKRSPRRDGLINVRVETLRTRFRDDLAERRCLVLADGFYEWAKTAEGKVPYRFVLSDGGPFAFAGIWEEREDGLGPVQSFAILTTAADAVVSPIHGRMPVILPREVEREWISPSRSPDEVLLMLQVERAVALRAYPVSTLVNRATVDTPEVSRPEQAEKIEPKTMNDLIEQWRAAVKPTLKRSSQMSYEWAFGRLVPTFGERFIGDITKVEVQRFLTAANRTLSGKSITNLRGWLRALLSVAVEWGWIESNPAAGRLRLPEVVPVRRKIVLEPAQFRKLRDDLASPYDCIVLLAVLSGLRMGELASLRWEDISPSSITVDEAVYAGTLGTPKTRKSRREVRIGKAVSLALEKWRNQAAFKGARDFVFAINVNTPIDLHNAMARYVRPACERLNLPKIGWHDLRHTYTTWGRRAGVPVEAMRDQLGHASAMLTLDVYSHVGDDRRMAAAAIEKYAKADRKSEPRNPKPVPVDDLQVA